MQSFRKCYISAGAKPPDPCQIARDECPRLNDRLGAASGSFADAGHGIADGLVPIQESGGR